MFWSWPRFWMHEVCLDQPSCFRSQCVEKLCQYQLNICVGRISMEEILGEPDIPRGQEYVVEPSFEAPARFDRGRERSLDPSNYRSNDRDEYLTRIELMSGNDNQEPQEYRSEMDEERGRGRGRERDRGNYNYSDDMPMNDQRQRGRDDYQRILEFFCLFRTRKNLVWEYYCWRFFFPHIQPFRQNLENGPGRFSPNFACVF